MKGSKKIAEMFVKPMLSQVRKVSCVKLAKMVLVPCEMCRYEC